MSVPNQWSIDGPSRNAPDVRSSKPYGAIQGAKIATSTSRPRKTRPAMARRFLRKRRQTSARRGRGATKLACSAPARPAAMPPTGRSASASTGAAGSTAV